MCKATQTTPLWKLLLKTGADGEKESLAMDIDFQICRPRGSDDKWTQRVGRISFVNTRGKVLYNTYVSYPYEHTLEVRVSGKQFNVEYQDIKVENGALPYERAEKGLIYIMTDMKIIGHGMQNDIKSIHPEIWKTISGSVDTQSLYGKINLKKISRDIPP